MASAAFRSTTKRTPMGPAPSSSAQDAGSSNRPHRRSRSLSRYSGRFPPPEPEPERATPRGRFVNTVRGSGLPEINLDDLASEFFVAIGDEVSAEELRRGRAGGRRVSSIGGSGSDASQRRGRSVLRKGSSEISSGGKSVSDASSRRRRSLSVARYRCSDSENDVDQHRNSRSNEKTKNSINRNIQKLALHKAEAISHQRSLRRSFSQVDLLQSHDGYSSYSSALTDDEVQDACKKNGNEKTIRAVYAQKKSDHPIGEEVGTGLLEVMRKEVQHAVEEIRTELEQVMVRTKPTVVSGGDSLPSDGVDIVRSIGEIRRSYTEKLEQSEKRKQDLLAELAVEEQRGREISKIVRELLPADAVQTTKPQRQSRRSNERSRMSRRLTEEAGKYFEDFLSNVEDTDFSSIDGERSDASSTLAGSVMSRDPIPCCGKAEVSDSLERTTLLPVEMDGVVLPWLQWETGNDNTPLTRTSKEVPLRSSSLYESNQGVSTICSSFASTSPKCSSSHSAIPGMNRCSDADSYHNHAGSRSSFKMDEYHQLHAAEDLLFERFNERHRIASGGLLICCRTFY